MTFLLHLGVSIMVAFLFDWAVSFKLHLTIAIVERDSGEENEHRYTLGPSLKLWAILSYLIPANLLVLSPPAGLTFTLVWFTAAITFYLLVVYRAEVSKFRGTPFKLL